MLTLDPSQQVSPPQSASRISLPLPFEVIASRMFRTLNVPEVIIYPTVNSHCPTNYLSHQCILVIFVTEFRDIIFAYNARLLFRCLLLECLFHVPPREVRHSIALVYSLLIPLRKVRQSPHMLRTPKGLRWTRVPRGRYLPCSGKGFAPCCMQLHSYPCILYPLGFP